MSCGIAVEADDFVAVGFAGEGANERRLREPRHEAENEPGEALVEGVEKRRDAQQTPGGNQREEPQVGLESWEAGVHPRAPQGEDHDTDKEGDMEQDPYDSSREQGVGPDRVSRRPDVLEEIESFLGKDGPQFRVIGGIPPVGAPGAHSVDELGGVLGKNVHHGDRFRFPCEQREVFRCPVAEVEEPVVPAVEHFGADQEGEAQKHDATRCRHGEGHRLLADYRDSEHLPADAQKHAEPRDDARDGDRDHERPGDAEEKARDGKRAEEEDTRVPAFRQEERAGDQREHPVQRGAEDFHAGGVDGDFKNRVAKEQAPYDVDSRADG